MKARIVQIAFLFIALWLPGCNESVEVLCEDAAQRQCERCTSCAEELAESSVTSAEICGVSAENCRSEIQEKCEFQSSTLEDPKTQLDECIQSLDRLTCDAVLTGYAQGSRTTTYECEYFL